MSLRIFKINKYEPAEDERRLSECAEKGEFIKEYLFDLACFKKGEPKKMRYCIEVSAFPIGRKKRKFYAENGWKLVCRGSDMNIFSSEGNAAPLHTDRAEYAHIIKKYHKILLAVAVMLCVLLLLFCSAPILGIFMMTKEFVMTFARWSMYHFGEALFMPMLMVTLIYMAAFFYYLTEAFKAGKVIAGSIENGKSAERAMRNNKLSAIIIAAVTVFAAAANIFYGYCSAVSSEYDMEIGDISKDAILAEDVFPAGRYIPVESEEDLEYIRPEERTGREKVYGSEVTGYNSAITDEYYWYSQQGILLGEGEEYGVINSINAEYIRFKAKPMAGLALMEIVRNEARFLNPQFGTSPIEHDASGTPFDRIITLTCTGDGLDRHLISLQRGKTVYALKIFSDDITTEELLENIIANS